LKKPDALFHGALKLQGKAREAHLAQALLYRELSGEV
jgi:hypothetical protein